MRRYLLLLFCFLQFASFGQSSPPDSHKIKQADSTSSRSQHSDSGYSRVEFRNNPVELQKMRENMDAQGHKEHKRTYTRIILVAILLTIILIVFIRRKQDRKTGN